MVVRDPVHGKAYDLEDLDYDDEIRICYTGPYGDRSSLSCVKEKVEHYLQSLENRGCSIDSLQLSH